MRHSLTPQPVPRIDNPIFIRWNKVAYIPRKLKITSFLCFCLDDSFLNISLIRFAFQINQCWVLLKCFFQLGWFSMHTELVNDFVLNSPTNWIRCQLIQKLFPSTNCTNTTLLLEQDSTSHWFNLIYILIFITKRSILCI